ncbi:MFS transporter [Saccharopolyspora sp. K220]|uniref:MFS transporter n=1 Tax=Saccharopolyspora soli TaxID=2926618 RepID=UPI001F5A82E5|nr:MFS transporter [Saccharopolyspora soli]MCI2420750.1 MFS transporter [Saccharopolyspora soli]
MTSRMWRLGWLGLDTTPVEGVVGGNANPLRTAAVSPLSEAGLRRVLLVLCGTEITSWGVLVYAFPVLAPAISADTGWSVAMLTAGFSVCQITAALTGVAVGRWLDRWGPRPVMTAGSLLAVPALLGVASATTPAWYFVAWIVAGLATSGVLYQPAFAALTRWWGPRRVTALTAVTLVAGLASTVFAPLTAVLNAHLDWRTTYVVLAVILGLITIPAHALGLRGAWPRAAQTEARHGDPGAVARSRAFIALAAAMSLGAFAIYAVVINLVPLLIERGMSTGLAAIALGLGGVGQVCGRLGYGRLVNSTAAHTRTAVVIAAGAATTGLLAVIPGPAALLIAAAMLAGAARGVFTLLQATAISDRWGAAQFGRLNGMLSAPVLVAIALAPWGGAALAEVFGGYSVVFAVLAGLAAFAALLSLASMPPDP